MRATMGRRDRAIGQNLSSLQNKEFQKTLFNLKYAATDELVYRARKAGRYLRIFRE
jgi:hypothetical protein